MHLEDNNRLHSTLEYLPPQIRSILLRLPPESKARIQEIRMRNQRPLELFTAAGIRFLSSSGTLTPQPEQGIVVHPEDLARAFQAVCAYSVHSHEQDLAEGFVTIKGGCRVGICGTAVLRPEQPMSLRNISSLNFRIAGAYPGIAASVWQQIGRSGGGFLIAGQVGSGKTTFLRDFCRLLGNTCHVALVDERGEIASMHHGTVQHDVGLLTDVLDGYPRHIGILTALRVLSPQYIVCDEISTAADADAMLQANGCGIRFAATCHAGSVEEVRQRPVLEQLLAANLFQYCIFLRDGQVQTVRRLAPC